MRIKVNMLPEIMLIFFY